MKRQSCIEPCANTLASADGCMIRTLNVHMHSECHLTERRVLCLDGVGLSYANKSLPRGARRYTMHVTAWKVTHTLLLQGTTLALLLRPVQNCTRGHETLRYVPPIGLH